MIVYSSDLKQFREQAEENTIARSIETLYVEILGKRPEEGERRAHRNSLQFMNNALRSSSVPDDCGVLIEFVLPLSSKRIDFMVTGTDAHGTDNAILVELKQWESAEETKFPDLVRTYVGRGFREVNHPSYQVASYRAFLHNFMETFYSGEIVAYACSYLHNYYPDSTSEPLLSEVYDHWLEVAPIFFSPDQAKLARFLHKHLQGGGGVKSLYKIRDSKIRPSKRLIDHVARLFRGHDEFVLLDDQKVAFEVSKAIAVNQQSDKNVVIIHGGPGTGKSVISMCLLRDVIKAGLNAAFVAPSAAFRKALEYKLCRGQAPLIAQHLFKGGGAFLECDPDSYQCLIVDEAHRLSGPKYQYFGENQVRDVITASHTSIFFVDDDQCLRASDIGSSDEIKRQARLVGANIDELELTAQFRCGGAEGYVNWLDHVWHIRETANFDGWQDEAFDFRIFHDPNELWREIQLRRKEGALARLLAGYAWPWSSRKINPRGEIHDVEIPEYGFAMPWNSRVGSERYFIDPDGDNQVGCIYTTQGLEFDYVGVLVGNDIEFDFESMSWRSNWTNYKDRAGKANLRDRPEELTRYITSIYKILMSRGMKGCYVFFRNESARVYFESRLQGM